jgi:hypothetical protein
MNGSRLSYLCDGILGIVRALLPPSPPAEKATARHDQAGKASSGDGSGDGDR